MSGQHDDVWCLHWGTSGLRDDELLLDAVVGLLCFLVALYTNPGGGGASELWVRTGAAGKRTAR